jgi:hypothetical protein
LPQIAVQVLAIEAVGRGRAVLDDAPAVDGAARAVLDEKAFAAVGRAGRDPGAMIGRGVEGGIGAQVEGGHLVHGVHLDDVLLDRGCGAAQGDGTGAAQKRKTNVLHLFLQKVRRSGIPAEARVSIRNIHLS